LKKEQEKQPKNEEKKQSGEVSRRDFLVGAGTVVVGGAIGAGILSGCSSGGTTQTVEITKTVTTTAGGAGAVTVTATKTTTVGAGQTVTVGGSGSTVTTTKTVTAQGTGGAVVPALEPEQEMMVKTDGPTLMMDVKNGKMVRGRPIHFPDKVTLTIGGKSVVVPPKQLIPPWWMATRKRVDSPLRLLYPLQRVDWAPGGDPAKINPQNRGISKYKRISWDEAATIVASELKRVADKYSPAAIWSCYASSNAGVAVGSSVGYQNLVDYWGFKNYGQGCTHSVGRGSSSEGGDQGGVFFVGGYEPSFSPSLIQDVATNSKLMLIWAGDVENSHWLNSRSGGWMHRFLHEKVGLPYVHISPDLNLGATILGAKWIPIRPQCDVALCLAIAYIWLQEGTYDKDYIASHSVGFDKWTPYVTGTEDGVPKTPEWAAPLTGIPVWTIKALAHNWAKQATTIVYACQGGGMGRGPYSSEQLRTQGYLQGMQSWGKPGAHQWHNGNGLSIGSTATNPVISAYKADVQISNFMTADTGRKLADTDQDRQFIAKNWFLASMQNAPVQFYGNEDRLNIRTFPLPADKGKGGSKIHMFFRGDPAWSSTRGHGFSCMDGHNLPDLECIVYCAFLLDEQCNQADILLPIAYQMELRDIQSFSGREAEGILMINKGVVPPPGEAKDDFGCVCAIADKLGLLDKVTGGLGYEAAKESWIKTSYDKCGWTNLVSWDELNTGKGYHFEPINAAAYNDPTNTTMYKFYMDPVKNPLTTPSGKLEYESQLLKTKQPDDPNRPVVSHWVLDQPGGSWKGSLSGINSTGIMWDEYPYGARAKTYPLSVVGGPNFWGYHSRHMDIPWDREQRFKVAWDGWAYSPLWINPDDAAARGIKNDDIVNVFNERGGVLFIAYLTEEVMPGSLFTWQGGASDCIVPNAINRGGEINCIAPAIASRWAMQVCHTGFLADVKKVTGADMQAWKDKYPEHFNKQLKGYDPRYGMTTDAWIVKGGA